MGENITVKRRKVVYDEYAGGFYAESKVESLQRQCDYRARLTDVMNKGEEAKYRFACKQVEAERQLFLMKKEKAAHRHAEALLDHRAHLSVLDKLAKEHEQTLTREDTLLGKYPPGSLRRDLEELIEKELKEMTPMVKRRREATKLFHKRNLNIDVNRSLTTDDLFEEIKNRKSRVPSPAKTPAPMNKHPASSHSGKQREMPKLILPAITVKLSRDGTRTRTNDSVKVSGDTGGNGSSVPLPSVFITDVKGSDPSR